MSRFTKYELHQRASAPLKKAVRKSADAILREASQQDRRSSHDVFLSHNHLDKKAVLGLKTVLEEAGYSVYVDSESDPQMNPENVTAETVATVKRRLRGSRSLLYATSENAESSKWMAWELGLGDGMRKRVAIVPVSETHGRLKNREFLQVYPEVQGRSAGVALWVRLLDRSVVQFDRWLSGT